MSCDSVEKSCRKTIQICRHYNNIIPENDEIYNELIAMAKLLEKTVPTFSAAGFYDINRGTIISSFSSLTTYMIIVLQFNASYI